MSFPDRRWKIHTPLCTYELHDYNWEITYVEYGLEQFDKELRYSGNAYWVIYTLCPQKGWRAEQVT